MQNDWQKWKMPIFTIVPRHAAAVSLGNPFVRFEGKPTSFVAQLMAKPMGNYIR